jgi:hypothetical protein
MSKWMALALCAASLASGLLVGVLWGENRAESRAVGARVTPEQARKRAETEQEAFRIELESQKAMTREAFKDLPPEWREGLPDGWRP